MKRGTLRIWVLTCTLILGWGVLGSADFYVIPVKQNPAAKPAPVAKTGQTVSYAPDDDGNLQKGVTWPNPRFTDNTDGTVTDTLTGLIWLQHASCFGKSTWTQALTDANTLVGDGTQCGLSDGSLAGTWRLPNRYELGSLLDMGCVNPAVPNTAGTGCAPAGGGDDPFSGVQSYNYWSSTTFAGITDNAWGMHLYAGSVETDNKTNTNYVWPVRGGQ